MSNIDPLASLITYVQAVKPYHTKIYEILLNYVYAEPVKASFGESYQIQVTMINPEANEWEICPGIGWDTAPWDTATVNEAYYPGTWDFPTLCTDVNPSRVAATFTEGVTFGDIMYPDDLVNPTMVEGPPGWDTAPWDLIAWDGGGSYIQLDTLTMDATGASITETLTFNIT